MILLYTTKFRVNRIITHWDIRKRRFSRWRTTAILNWQNFGILLSNWYCKHNLSFITWEVERIRQRGRPKKTWWDCVKNDLESLGLSQKDAQSRNKWRRIKGATGWRRFTWKTVSEMTYTVSSGTLNCSIPYHHLNKWPLKRSVCVCDYQTNGES